MVTRLGTGMIDKLDLRIPTDAHWSPAVGKIFSYDPLTPFSTRVRPAQHYEGRTDLRAVGMDAILHVKCRHGDKHSKLEILDVGQKPYSEIVRLIQGVAVVELDRLGILRIDLTADVPGVTVPWLRSHTRLKFKRQEREYGQLQYGTVARCEVETLTYGSRPNVIRLYNKVEECRSQFRRMQRKRSKEADPIDFEREFGLKETDILTRIERQCGGSRIPPEVASFQSLQSLPDFNPFTSLEIISSQRHSLPSPQECEGLEYYTGLGMYTEAERMGMQSFRKQLNQQSPGNAARTIERYGRFFPGGSQISISIEQIVEAYRQSTIDQLAA
jgi:hypothetical protein